MHIIFKFQIITHSYTGTCIIKPGYYNKVLPGQEIRDFPASTMTKIPYCTYNDETMRLRTQTQ